MRFVVLFCLVATMAGTDAGQAQPLRPAPSERLAVSDPVGAAPKTPLLVERDKQAFQRIAREEAEKAKVPFDLVDAVMRIESGYNPNALGDLDEVGLMQVRPGTAAMLGFKSAEASLATPAVNIHYGTTYLAEAWRRAGGDVCRALMKYRAGHGQDFMSPLSADYCARAKAHLVAINSPLASEIGEVALMPAVLPTPPSLREPTGRPKTGAAFWTAFTARIERINARIETKWRRSGARTAAKTAAR